MMIRLVGFGIAIGIFLSRYCFKEIKVLYVKRPSKCIRTLLNLWESFILLKKYGKFTRICQDNYTN